MYGLWDRLREFLRWFYRYRSIRLTPDGTRFVLLTLAVGVAAVNTGNNLLYLLLAMLLSLIVMSGLLSEQCLRQLEIRRVLPREVYANHPATGAFAIANRKPRLPTFSLRVQDIVGSASLDRGVHLLHLPPGASTLQPYPLLIPRRGRYRLDGIKLLTRFPFGLFLKAANLPLADELIVYPERQPLPEHLAQELAALGHEQPQPRRGAGVALYNLRGYHAGDDSRAIHWKTSARQAQLIVKETESEEQREVLLALPMEVPPDAAAAFEQAVALTASLAAFFHGRGYAVDLLLGDRLLPRASDAVRLERILGALALCEARPVSDETAVAPVLAALGAAAARGALTLLIAPWADPRLASAGAVASRILTAGEAA